MDSSSSSRPDTDKLKDPSRIPDLQQKVTYRRIPHTDAGDGTPKRAVWRVRFDLASDRSVSFGLDINDEIIFGRSLSGNNSVDLSKYGADELGVSRQHLMMRPTPSNLYAMDMGSTNGTLHNGRSIGLKTPRRLTNGDTLSLGQLQFIVRIVKRPKGQTERLHEKADLGDALTQIARVLTSQLKLDEVLSQVVELAMALTKAGETAVWLVDEKSNELYLEAERGIEDEDIRRMRLPVTDTLAGEVIKSGKSIRAKSEPGGDQVKLKTGYLVDALIYVPLIIGGEPIGVLAAAHRESGKAFAQRDEKLLAAIGDFAAIAVQNSRLYEATDEALARRVQELAALNELSTAVSSSLDIQTVNKVLMEQIRMHWNVEGASLWLIDREMQQVTRLSSSADDANGADNTTFDLGQGLVGKVAQSASALFENDTQANPEFDASIDLFDQIATESMACVPLTVTGDVVGVLALFNKQDGDFTEDDIERLQAFALPVATAIENGRLFADSERERATVRATASALSQPLIILDERGQVVIFNEAAEIIIDEHLAQLIEGLSGVLGHATQLTLGDDSYVTSMEHVPGVGTIIIMQDMTYVKRLELARAEFIYALSHDLKGPLSSIKGYGQLLSKAPNVSLGEQGQLFMTRIVDSSDRLLDMVSQLLDIALLSEAPQVKHTRCNLVDTIEKATTDMEGAAEAKSIDLSLKISGKPYSITGDAERIYRSMLNLLDNAIKYSDEEAFVKVELAFNNDQVAIKVRDSGPGIPDEDQPFLFDKYFRGRQQALTLPGIGLGLVMVQSTIEMHEGTITARNHPDGGAEFEITLPASLRIE